MKGPVLVVDDDEQVANMVALTLRSEGIADVHKITDSRQVMDVLRQKSASLILLDMLMPNLSGRDLLPLIKQEYPHLPVVMVTGLSDVEIVVECMKAGAYDYLLKPVEPSRLIACVKNVQQVSDLRNEISILKQYLLTDSLKQPEAFAAIKTCSKKMRAIFQYAEAVSASCQPVLITGETGVGKELMARAIHQLSGVKGNFVAVNVAGLDDAMFSDALFGHTKGAFTGADQVREGLIRKAAGGTLFLDEIGDLHGASQIKLLRLLQEGDYFPVGSDSVKKSDARIVAATNHNLQEEMRSGRFRSDLYYRLCAHTIELPPLRERPEDIPLLTIHMVEETASVYGKQPPLLSTELIPHLRAQAYPGNVRELRGLVLDAMARHQEGLLTCEHFRLSKEMCRNNVQVDSSNHLLSLFGHFPSFHEIEDYLIDEALVLSSGNHNLAASLLGVTRQTITNRLKARANGKSTA
ncbi:MAG: sigma-54 dependent transcriptional regulator [Trichlorobacter sp.]|uniref:sigma-54-dependent transcriptional regulator n=1 Tax=Trichlorobacter sp. TaxID=2911007 RepID=UPI00256E78C9|nr:sigma-54 dependent transcriptional regulator [Trichlorobacter sp.]MDK9719011.1 sigma-54 dependent transcriptional regulator [Trichlorobacter sp.]